jgi:serine/threonine-protein kinase
VSASSSQPPIRFGKYTLVERLGRGGMAEVWRATLAGPGGFARNLVLKRILPALAEDERFIDMFLKEARLLARLNHPNIVQVFELGEIDGRWCITMELVDGRDVSWLLSELVARGPVPIGFAPLVVREVCRALAYAHALTDDNGVPLRIIHRDISPSNIMVDRHGGVKLLDFGVAKALAEATQARTQTGVIKGKLWYMAPERLDDGDFDHRADLFAAGCVLFEGLTGRRLLTADTPVKVFKQVLRIQPPSRERPDVPLALDRVCMRALAAAKAVFNGIEHRF